MYEERRENSRKNNPSFSSTLLDEIYRSIDENTEDSMYFYRSVNLRAGNIGSNSGQAEKRGGCLVDKKWMMEDENHARRSRADDHENKDYNFLNSSSVSCFSRAKPVRTIDRQEEEEEDHEYSDKSKSSRALKIYASLRKVKQPISPGGKLTSFINSLFNHDHAKKENKKKKLKKQSMESSSTSNCSSASSSYSRSCLSSNKKSRNTNNDERRVRFDPVTSVILNEESKSGGDPNYNCNLRRLRLLKKNHWNHVDEDQNAKIQTSDDIMMRKNYYTEILDDDNDDDATSDSSSDLFELDHLSLFGHTRFCQELPMYETTHHYATNRAIN